MKAKIDGVRVYSAHDGCGWSLSINGRELVTNETFAVVDGIRDELEGVSSGVGELREVADTIREALK